MDMVWPVLGLIAVVTGLAGIALPVLPGMPLLFGGLWLIDWSDGYARIGEITVISLGLFTGLAAGISFLLGNVAKLGLASTMIGIFTVSWML